MRRSEPDVLVGARRGSPLVVGRGEGENFLASDIPAFLEHTREMVVIDDDRVVEIRPDSVALTDLDGKSLDSTSAPSNGISRPPRRGATRPSCSRRSSSSRRPIADTLAGRVDGARARDPRRARIEHRKLREIDKVFVVACGTSYHAAMMAKYAIERWTRLPVEIDIASEFRYRDPVLDCQFPGHRDQPVG